MRRWNGWGDDKLDVPLSESNRAMLAQLLGPGVLGRDASLDDVLSHAPPPRTVEHGSISNSTRDRILHARGQSFEDWVALRSGRLGALPDGVAHPLTEQEITAVLAWAKRQRVRIIPYGGGTSVTGHINVPSDKDGQPLITLALDRAQRLEHLDAESRIARFQPGVVGPELERRLQEHGFRLGHYPQSFEYSTLGGWIATRSSGQESYGYGRIEDLLAGCRMATFDGILDLPPLPASAAGPDLKQWVLGSEGRLGVITSASVRVTPLPELESFHAVIFPTFMAGISAVRAAIDEGSSLSMLRLSDADETASLFHLPKFAERGLEWFGYPEGRCILLFGAAGSRSSVIYAIARAYALCRAHGGLPTGSFIGDVWHKNRFKGPYLRNALWDAGYAADTLETAAPWASVPRLAAELKRVLNAALEARDERVTSFAHLSHVYCDGASVYVTYLFRRTTDPDELIERWRMLKDAASRTIVNNGGTISHQHGVGTDHLPYLEPEKSPVGIAMLQNLFSSVDPEGLLNPGKLVPSRRG